MSLDSPTWYQHLGSWRSKGSQHDGRGTLGGLHEDRREHAGQFFTPVALAAWVWRLLSPSLAALSGRVQRKLAIADTSAGVGRLLQFANPALHALFVSDVDAAAVEAFGEAARAAGFTVTTEAGGMETMKLRNMDVVILNPPFSIPLESPLMEPLAPSSHGRFGPKTSCVSHVFAVAQALKGSAIVAAIVPRTFADELVADPYFLPRLRLIADLPRSTFKEEGAWVATSVVVFDAIETELPVMRMTVDDVDAPPPALNLWCGGKTLVQPQLIKKTLDASVPAVLTPYTGNNSVRVTRVGRRIGFRFACGLTEAKVRNSVAGARIAEHRDDLVAGRLPRGLQFTGDGVLDLHTHLIQDDPLSSFRALVEQVEAAGGAPLVDPAVEAYLAKHVRRLRRHAVPFGHTIRVKGTGDAAVATAKKSFLLDPKKWGSPVVKAGESVRVIGRTDGAIRFKVAEKLEWEMSSEEFASRFAATDCPDRWEEKFAGRLAAFPQQAHELRLRAERLGLNNVLSFGYQLEDLLELVLAPYGGVIAWDMGLGKARLALALCLMHQAPRNLVVVQAHLLDEMVTECGKIGLSANDWQVIAAPEHLKDLRRINIISYARLRMPVRRDREKVTYGKALRRRVSVVVADEGHVARNLQSDQTRAMWALAARRRYLLTGTPLANYPRDLLPLIAWVYGDGTAWQPYGLRRAFLEKNHRQSVSHAVRGVDQFRSDFVTLEWVTNEFAEEMQDGAKREIPKIADLAKYRALVAPLIKRRVAQEPEVAKFIRIPTPAETVITLPWDREHLAYYMSAAEDFREWYLKRRSVAGQSANSMVALLARVGAVVAACNNPHQGYGEWPAFRGGSTAKERYAVTRAAKWAREGHKTIIFVQSPASADRLARQLAAEGIAAVTMHGGISRAERTRALRDEFRLGQADVLVATVGVSATGLNIPEADRVLFLCRSWTSTQERQARARVLRPQQKREVLVEYLQLEGSIDEYQAQMVAHKGESADAGLDWVAPTLAGEDFLHMDTLLYRFVEALIGKKGRGREFREALAS